MAKKIHLVNKKKGMTLVEMMASLAILLILFGGITSMILTNMKAEIKSNTRMENISYIKAIMAMFESGKENISVSSDGSISNNSNYYISNSIFKENFLNKIVYLNFDFLNMNEGNYTEEQLQEKLLSGNVNELSVNDDYASNTEGKKYQCVIHLSTVNSQSNNDLMKLYKLDVKLRNNFNEHDSESVSKQLYISR